MHSNLIADCSVMLDRSAARVDRFKLYVLCATGEIEDQNLDCGTLLQMLGYVVVHVGYRGSVSYLQHGHCHLPSGLVFNPFPELVKVLFVDRLDLPHRLNSGCSVIDCKSRADICRATIAFLRVLAIRSTPMLK